MTNEYLGLGPFQGTYYGSLFTDAIAMQSNANALPTNQIFEFGDHAILQINQQKSYTAGDITGEISISNNGTSTTLFNCFYGVDKKQQSTLYLSEYLTAPIIILKITDGDSYFFYRVHGMLVAYDDSKTYTTYIIFGKNDDTDKALDWFIGIPAPTTTYPTTGYSGTYYPGTKPPIVNPYQPGGESGPGGGDGTFDDESDPIEMPSLPTLSSANTGFTRIYNPTLAQVQNLANYLWTDESVVQTIWNHIKQYFENPMDAIIGFNLVPVPVPDGGTQEFKLMYIPTGIDMTVAASQFVDVDCGTVKLDPYYGSALDYSPYTRVSCFLPYIGTVSLNVDEVMNRTLQVKYRVDICSGSCVAYVLVDGNAIYQYSGHCAIPIPLGSADFSSYVSAAISIAKLGVTAAAFGAAGLAGAGAATAAQETGNIVTTTQAVQTARNPETGRQVTTGTSTITRTKSVPPPTSRPMSTKAALGGIAPENIANT